MRRVILILSHGIISDSDVIAIDQSAGTTDEEYISFDGFSEGTTARVLHIVETQVTQSWN